VSYSIRTVTAISAIAAAIDVDAAKAHLNVDFDDDDALIADQVKAAQDRIEAHLGRPLTDRVLELTLGAFPYRAGVIKLPLLGITAIGSLKYTDVAGAEQTLISSSYRWSAADPERILPAFGAEWPSSVACDPGALRIRFNAGYAAGECPSALVEALKRLTAYLYENREGAGDIPPGVVSLCARYRRVTID
jgi:uncharacterized phiE125 gp8 family phage protein